MILRCLYRGIFAVVVLTFSLLSQKAEASEYCVTKYNDAITKVSAELGSLISRQDQIDQRIGVIVDKIVDLSTQLAAASSHVPIDVNLIRQIGTQITALKSEEDALKSEGFRNQDRIVALKGFIPAGLEGELRGCVQASAPTNRLVNLAIQGLAILSTGGASLLLPPKTLYVDMSQVLNGYPTGGSGSVINKSREDALNALGLGGKNNDIGRTVRDPGRALRCMAFGC